MGPHALKSPKPTESTWLNHPLVGQLWLEAALHAGPFAMVVRYSVQAVSTDTLICRLPCDDQTLHLFALARKSPAKNSQPSRGASELTAVSEWIKVTLIHSQWPQLLCHPLFAKMKQPGLNPELQAVCESASPFDTRYDDEPPQHTTTEFHLHPKENLVAMIKHFDTLLLDLEHDRPSRLPFSPKASLPE